MERDSRFSPLTNYPQLFKYVSQTAIRCFSAVHSVARAVLHLLLVLFRAVAVVVYFVHTSHRMDIYIS